MRRPEPGLCPKRVNSGLGSWLKVGELEETEWVMGSERQRLVVVDAANVVGSRPDGWWRDRAGAARRLIAKLVEYQAHAGSEGASVDRSRFGGHWG